LYDHRTFKKDVICGSSENPQITRNIHGDVDLGPTAIPAFGRENYGVFEGMDKEAIDILLSDAHLPE